MSGIYKRRIKKEGKEGEADVDELMRLDIRASVAVLQQCIRCRVKAILSITAMHMRCLSSRVDVALSTPLSSV
ncbi:hypothetical protein CDAR_36671 [Caerostris darwini]|uniref:Uncharacterized protein n=1 Tax=Caerostris darwini TaxID=1538125 RepID=A0AAV4UV79_9ARAC|nr:hypothetical protein CDAR_36671 [Caerostris darwini]